MTTKANAAANPPSSGASVTPQGFMMAVTLFLVCQLIGETVVKSLGVAFPGFTFPGPVLGMVILFALLLARGKVTETVGVASNGILRNLSLLFVPAAVGIVQYWDVIIEFGLTLVTALVLSTLLTLIVTVLVFVVVAKYTSGPQDAETEDGDAR